MLPLSTLFVKYPSTDELGKSHLNSVNWEYFCLPKTDTILSAKGF